MSPVDIALLLAVGLGVGFLAGLLGIGGGALLIPAMVLLLGFDQHLAQGTSLLVIIPSAAVGSLAHHRARRFSLTDVGALALGGVAGAALGGLAALSVDDLLLRRLFAGLLALVALRLLLGGRRAPPVDAPPAATAQGAPS